MIQQVQESNPLSNVQCRMDQARHFVLSQHKLITYKLMPCSAGCEEIWMMMLYCITALLCSVMNSLVNPNSFLDSFQLDYVLAYHHQPNTSVCDCVIMNRHCSKMCYNIDFMTSWTHSLTQPYSLPSITLEHKETGGLCRRTVAES